MRPVHRRTAATFEGGAAMSILKYLDLLIYALVLLSVGALLWDMKKGGRN